MISILSHTEEQFSEKIFSLFGKGKRHAGLLYSNWMKGGRLVPEQWAEKQALGLIGEMIRSTYFPEPEISSQREDGKAVKFLLKYQDGLESESVLIPMQFGTTLCVSSQVGCKMGCLFCETGRMGLLRHLTAEEIVLQIFASRFKFDAKIRNIVFMGMGEPFDNYDAVMQAIRVLCDPAGFGFGPSRITVSTSGRVDNIYRFIEDADPAVNLAVSVNAPNDLIRTKIMPINRKWNMAALKKAMEDYCKHPRREILVEYVLLKDVNDTPEGAEELADYLTGLKVKVNLIPYNSQTRSRYAAPELETQKNFMQILQKRGYRALLRRHKGREIMAACGQLGNLKLPKISANR